MEMGADLVWTNTPILEVLHTLEFPILNNIQKVFHYLKPCLYRHKIEISDSEELRNVGGNATLIDRLVLRLMYNIAKHKLKIVAITRAK
jgi:hypothetical protein